MTLDESAADVRSNSRHVAREKSCVLAFLFPHSLLFCGNGMLAHQLTQQLAPTIVQPACGATQKQLKLTARPARRWGGSHRAERMTYSCFQRNRGRWLSGSVARATTARRRAAVTSARNRPRVDKKVDNGRSCSGRNQKRHRAKGWDRVGRHD